MLRIISISFSVIAVLSLAACAKKPAPTPAANTQSSAATNNNPTNAVSTALVGPKAKRTIVFNCNSVALPKTATAMLKTHAQYLITNPNANILLESFTPNAGSVNVNVAEGEERNQAVASYLALQGVKPGQIKTVSYGGAYKVNLPNMKIPQCRVDIVYQ